MTTQNTDFPIPADLPEGFWNWDRIHCPHPTHQLEQELMLDTTAAGFTRSMDEMGSPFGVVSRLINNYSYLTFVPLDFKGEDPDERAARYRQNVAELMPKVTRALGAGMAARTCCRLSNAPRPPISRRCPTPSCSPPSTR